MNILKKFLAFVCIVFAIMGALEFVFDEIEYTSQSEREEWWAGKKYKHYRFTSFDEESRVCGCRYGPGKTFNYQYSLFGSKTPSEDQRIFNIAAGMVTILPILALVFLKSAANAEKKRKKKIKEKRQKRKAAKKKALEIEDELFG